MDEELGASGRRAARRLRSELERRFAQPPGGTLWEWGQRLLPAHFSQPPSAMHRWLAEELASWTGTRGQRLNVIGPRGSAKSTLVTLAYVLRETLEGREPYVWIVSESRHQAQAHLENLRQELAGNEELRRAYASAAGARGRAQSLRLANGAAIDAFGTGQRIRGRRFREHRPSLIVGDDLQSDNHMYSRTLREMAQRWFEGTLLRAGTGATNVLHLATALHREAIGQRLLTTPGWRSRVFAAVTQWPTDEGLWSDWEKIYGDPERGGAIDEARAFFERHRAAMEAGAEVLWPEGQGLYELMRMRCESGRATFAREMQGQPLDPEACEWPESYFGDELWFDEWPPRLALKVAALDPSKGARGGRGDYSALVVLGIDRQGRGWVDAELGRWPTEALVEQCVELVLRERPTALAIEANQFQDLLGVLVNDELQRRGGADCGLWSLENRVNKGTRIRRLGPLLAQGRLRFRRGSSGARLVVNQLQEFPVGDHDDGPDAVEMAWRLAGELTAGRTG